MGYREARKKNLTSTIKKTFDVILIKRESIYQLLVKSFNKENRNKKINAF